MRHCLHLKKLTFTWICKQIAIISVYFSSFALIHRASKVSNHQWVMETLVTLSKMFQVMGKKPMKNWLLSRMRNAFPIYRYLSWFWYFCCNVIFDFRWRYVQWFLCYDYGLYYFALHWVCIERFCRHCIGINNLKL